MTISAPPAHRLDGREPIAELGPDRGDLGRLEVELTGDLVEDRGLAGRDRVVGRAHEVAGTDEGQPLLGRGERAVLAGHDVVLGPADEPGRALGDLGHEDRLRLGQALLDEDAARSAGSRRRSRRSRPRPPGRGRRRRWPSCGPRPGASTRAGRRSGGRPRRPDRSCRAARRPRADGASPRKRRRSIGR